MCTEALNSILLEINSDPSVIHRLLKQGIEVEELKMQLADPLNLPTLDQFLETQQGERFLMLLSSCRKSSHGAC